MVPPPPLPFRRSRSTDSPETDTDPPECVKAERQPEKTRLGRPRAAGLPFFSSDFTRESRNLPIRRTARRSIRDLEIGAQSAIQRLRPGSTPESIAALTPAPSWHPFSRPISPPKSLWSVKPPPDPPVPRLHQSRRAGGDGLTTFTDQSRMRSVCLPMGESSSRRPTARSASSNSITATAASPSPRRRKSFGLVGPGYLESARLRCQFAL